MPNIRQYTSRLLLAALLLFLLSSCASGKQDNDALALQFRADYRALTQCEGALRLQADYGERVYAYALDFSLRPEEGLLLQLREPEELAGLSAVLREGESYLHFDGATLETGPLSPEGLSPIDALPALLHYLREGYLAATGSEMLGERESLRLQYRAPETGAGEGSEAVIWLDPLSGALLQAELSQNGFCVLRCQFERFTSGESLPPATE